MTTQSVEVRFKGNRRTWHTWAAGEPRLRLNEGVVVQAERGLDFGWVNRNEAVESSCDGCTSCATGDVSAEVNDVAPPGTGVDAPAGDPDAATAPVPASPEIPQVVRRATPRDIAKHEELRRGEEDVRRHVMARVAHYQLPMRISDAEWQWDGNRLTVYFTAERRVDFRELARELASHFRTRIELRQIGVRDEAARLGGVGRCGREYCCSTWLDEPGPVNLALAKDQRLSLNPSQISGGCGRLLCCLKYEHEFYLNSRKRFPKEGKMLVTLSGNEKVIAVDIFRERVYLRGDDSPGRVVPLLQLRDEVEAAAVAAPAGMAAAPAEAAAPDPNARRRPPGPPRGPRGGPPPGKRS